MGFHLNKMGSRVRFDPQEAARMIIKAYRDKQGLTIDVARIYEVVPSTLKRWIVQLDDQGFGVRDAIDEIREAARRS